MESTPHLMMGAAVVVSAADDFYRFIDGWRGTVSGYNAGCVQIDCINPDGQAVQFLVPPDQLKGQDHAQPQTA